MEARRIVDTPQEGEELIQEALAAGWDGGSYELWEYCRLHASFQEAVTCAFDWLCYHEGLRDAND